MTIVLSPNKLNEKLVFGEIIMTYYDKFDIGTNWQGTDLWGTYYDGIEILNKKILIMHSLSLIKQSIFSLQIPPKNTAYKPYI